ncbi:MAG: ACP S-malonyltransferase [Deltaproteobacteria bacterium]|nr:ACP S-malonyltransferase [Deltaproteobacteria bacterium]MBW2344687.1 ACP S-malonyltransferase [Deltaproteobacteria bacterium]
MKYKKITLVFPGQGSQYVGMGKEFYDRFDFVKDIYNQAKQVLGYDLSEQCFRKRKFGKMIMHKDDLNKTIYTQPAVLTTSYACFKVFEKTLRERGLDVNVPLLAGHSLGEYTALLIAGAMDFKTCLSLVKTRATYMTDLGRGYPGAGLMAIVGKKKELDYDSVCTLCKDFGVYVTLNNTPKQIVVGGSKKNLAAMSKKLKEDGKRSTMLKVEGPFHTPIMKPAANKFKRVLDKIPIRIASKPIIANVSTHAIVDPDHTKKELFEQIYKIVDWRGSVEKLINNGGDLFIEVGPKKVLSNMIKDIDPSIPNLNVEDVESLEKTANELAG